MNRTLLVEQLPGLRRYARALTGDAWAADDLVQDTLERACAKWQLWVAGSDLRAWLFTLMHNIFLNQRRAAKVALNSVSIDDVEAELQATRSPPATVALDLSRCLQRLPADQRAVLLLVTLEDMSYEDAAKVLGDPVGNGDVAPVARAQPPARADGRRPARRAARGGGPGPGLRRMK